MLSCARSYPLTRRAQDSPRSGGLGWLRVPPRQCIDIITDHVLRAVPVSVRDFLLRRARSGVWPARARRDQLRLQRAWSAATRSLLGADLQPARQLYQHPYLAHRERRRRRALLARRGELLRHALPSAGTSGGRERFDRG